MNISLFLEIARLAGAFTGFWLAFNHTSDPKLAFRYLSVWVVTSIAGMAAIESLLFPGRAAAASGYADPGHYQRQSGLNNLAVAIMSLVVYYLHWGTEAEAAICLVLLIFLSLSALNHGHSLWCDGNRSWRGITRPLGILILVVAAIPFMYRAIVAVS